ncbi:MAG: GNAT family N-acetyltransferase [Eubacteriales bacterium]|jgi:serine/alanine adding enzyme|nr:GNAT family N-acetyltransferase [Eubacteriales bacterium]
MEIAVKEKQITQGISDAGDIYYNESYGKSYEDIEKGEYIKFEFISNRGTVLHPFIKRPLPWLIDGKQYYDIVTPYGYGGPLIIKLSGNENELMSDFASAFNTYCVCNDIICEFIRFHTLYENHRYCGNIYNIAYKRRTIAIDLTDPNYYDTQFNAKCRNRVRKAIKNGIIIEPDRELNTIDTFAEIYYMTMTRNCAEDCYFFSKDYFHGIRNNLAGSALLVNAKYEGQIIAASLSLYTVKGFAHCHLTATNPDYYPLAANNLILKTVCDMLRTYGCTWLHLGGGLSSAEDDPLFKFKRTFGRGDKNFKDFYLGNRVINNEIYDKAIKIRNEQEKKIADNNCFLLHRG